MATKKNLAIHFFDIFFKVIVIKNCDNKIEKERKTFKKILIVIETVVTVVIVTVVLVTVAAVTVVIVTFFI